MFLDAIMPREFGDRFTKGKDPFHFAWVTQDYPQDKCVGELNGCPTLPSKMFSFGTVPKDKWKVSGLEQASAVSNAEAGNGSFATRSSVWVLESSDLITTVSPEAGR